MNFKKLVWLGAILIMMVGTPAQTPSAEQLLPDDTIALFTVPDWTKMMAYYNQSPYSQLWNDPAMAKFKENFDTKFKDGVTGPVEKELGIKLGDYQELLQGQVTVALTPPREGSKDPLGLLVMLDTKGKSDQLKSRLEEIRKKWNDSGKQTRVEKIRDTDFSVISFTDKEWSKFMQGMFPGFGGEEEESSEPGEPTTLHIGQYKSMLLIGENPKVLEKIIAKQSGGTVSTLSEQANFQKLYGSKFRDSLGFAWLNWKPMFEFISKELTKDAPEEAAPGMPNLSMEKILPTLGFKGLDSISFNVTGTPEGMGGEFFVAVPESQREGLFQMFALLKKDASPAPFVPADAVQFQRWRIDVPKVWTELENLLRKIEPGMAGMLTMMLDGVGKEKDPNFDFRKNFIGNIGDDIITFAKAPKSAKPEEIAAAPTLILIGSSKAEELLETFRTLTFLMPPTISSEPPKEREFLGKKIYSLTASTGASEEEDADEDTKETPQVTAATLSFTASGGFVAFSTDAGLLEDYLRSGEASGKSLRSVAGIAEAAQKVGGMEQGFFGYENQKETMRVAFVAMKQAQSGIEGLFLPNSIQLHADENADGTKDKGWFDYSVLPNYDAVSKYFGIGVYSGALNPQGLSFRFYGPAPTGLKK